MGRLTQDARMRMRLDFERGRAAVANGALEGTAVRGAGAAAEEWEPTMEEEALEREWGGEGELAPRGEGGARARGGESARRRDEWEPTSDEEVMEDQGWEQVGWAAVEPLARGQAWDAVGVG